MTRAGRRAAPHSPSGAGEQCAPPPPPARHCTHTRPASPRQASRAHAAAGCRRAAAVRGPPRSPRGRPRRGARRVAAPRRCDARRAGARARPGAATGGRDLLPTRGGQVWPPRARAGAGGGAPKSSPHAWGDSGGAAGSAFAPRPRDSASRPARVATRCAAPSQHTPHPPPPAPPPGGGGGAARDPPPLACGGPFRAARRHITSHTAGVTERAAVAPSCTRRPPAPTGRMGEQPQLARGRRDTCSRPRAAARLPWGAMRAHFWSLRGQQRRGLSQWRGCSLQHSRCSRHRLPFCGCGGSRGVAADATAARRGVGDDWGVLSGRRPDTSVPLAWPATPLSNGTQLSKTINSSVPGAK